MAHNLATTNGRTAMMFCGEEPWHKFGTKLENPATAAEAIEAAGLNYQVELVPLFTQDGNQVPKRQGVLFQRIWHKAWAKLSNGLLGG
jgi:hypothetical protein